MKNLLYILLAATLTSCTVSRLSSQQKAERNERVARLTAERIEKRDFEVDMDFVHPSRGGGRPLDYGWSVRISGDSIYSYLPYFGRAYSIPYGGGKGLNFSGIMREYKIMEHAGDHTDIAIVYVNEEDTYNYYFRIYDNGSTDLSVISREREKISFSGEMKDMDE